MHRRGWTRRCRLICFVLGFVGHFGFRFDVLPSLGGSGCRDGLVWFGAYSTSTITWLAITKSMDRVATVAAGRRCLIP